MPSGANIDVTDYRIQQIEQAIIEETGEPDPSFALGEEKIADSDLQILISNIGVLNDWPAAYTPNIGPGDAFMLVQLKGKSGRPGAFDYVEALREKLNSQFPDVGIRLRHGRNAHLGAEHGRAFADSLSGEWGKAGRDARNC